LKKVYQGERPLCIHNKLISVFELPLTPKPRGVNNVEITLEVNEFGKLSITATEMFSGNKEEATIKDIFSITSKSEVEEMIASEEANRFVVSQGEHGHQHANSVCFLEFRMKCFGQPKRQRRKFSALWASLQTSFMILKPKADWVKTQKCFMM